MAQFRMNFVEDTKFLFTGFHTGFVNIMLHIISIAVLIVGLKNHNLFLSILGLAVFDELGLIYNYIVHHREDPKYNPLRMLPYQIIYFGPPALILFKMFDLIPNLRFLIVRKNY